VIQGRPPRVLLLNWRDLRNPLAGGAEVHVHEVLRRLVAKGWEAVLCCHAVPGLPEREVMDGVEIRRQGGANTFNFTVWMNLRRWIREERADLVIDNSNKLAFLAPWISQVPVAGLINHLFGKVIWQEAAPLGAACVALSEWLVPHAYRDTVMMAVSNSAKAEFEDLGMQRVVNVGSGVELEGFRLPEPGERKPFQLLTLGRIKKYKGLEVMLHAVKTLTRRFPEVTLVVAGAGDDIPRLKSIAQDLGIATRVVFAGKVSGEEKLRLYRESSVFLNSSMKEGYGLTSIEANACGTPVVASDVPGLCDSVRDGETGFLFPFGDHEALANRIGQILSNPELAARLQAQAVTWAHRNSWDAVAQETEKVLNKLLGRA
jgi:glycosyltransferase involved in cell wall biosynthesis